MSYPNQYVKPPNSFSTILRPSFDQQAKICCFEKITSPCFPLAIVVSGQGSAAFKRMHDTEIKFMISSIVNAALCAEYKKIPMRKDDLTKLLSKEKIRAFPILLEKANEELKSIFGMELVELPNRNRKGGLKINDNNSNITDKLPRTGSYILRNCLSSESRAAIIPMDELSLKRFGLLMLILSYLYINNREASEEDLFKILRKFHLDADKSYPDDDPLNGLGKVEDEIALFVKQL